jgi:hypothetical protein
MCKWSVEGLCIYYRWADGADIRCNGRHAACLGQVDSIIEINPLTSDPHPGKAIFTSKSGESAIIPRSEIKTAEANQ